MPETLVDLPQAHEMISNNSAGYKLCPSEIMKMLAQSGADVDPCPPGRFSLLCTRGVERPWLTSRFSLLCMMGVEVP